MIRRYRRFCAWYAWAKYWGYNAPRCVLFGIEGALTL